MLSRHIQWWAGGSSILPAPIFESSRIDNDVASGTSHTFGFSGLSTTGFDVYGAIGNAVDSATLSSFSGGTDDTSSGIASVATDPIVYLRSIAINSTFDTSWTATWANSCRSVASLFSISGATNTNTATNSGSGAALPSHASFGLTGGPYEVLVVDIANIQGCHVTNEADAPVGHTRRQHDAAGTDEPTSTIRNTLAIATRTYLVDDLTWTTGSATIPAATWQGLEDIASQPWSTIRFVAWALP